MAGCAVSDTAEDDDPVASCWLPLVLQSNTGFPFLSSFDGETGRAAFTEAHGIERDHLAAKPNCQPAKPR
jgi:hypothetical protein